MSLGFIGQTSPHLNRAVTDDTVHINKSKMIITFLNIAAVLSIVAHLILLSQNYIWYLPFIFSLLGYVIFLYPFDYKDILKTPRWIVYSPCATALFLYLKVSITFFVAVWTGTFILAALIPINDKKMINYAFDSINHTISSLIFYGIIRGFSAYSVQLGLPKQFSLLIPFCIGNIETFFMIIIKNQAYTFSAKSVIFFQYAVLKSAILIALPIIEEYIIQIIINDSDL